MKNNEKLEISSTPYFLKQAKILKKKYSSFDRDLDEIKESLQTNPFQGTSLGRNCYKIRFAIESKGKGKSGGGRLITLVKIVENKILLLSVYDKSEIETITDQEIISLLNENQF
ncbi:MAG: hypothetical protein HW421_2057 [Ignavibacteria bacterium]|nr:hypothetical protein [Ignavibacteria bacterium]